MCGFETKLSELLIVTLLIYQLNCVGHGSEIFKMPHVFEAQSNKVLFLASFIYSLSITGTLDAWWHSGKESTCHAGDAGSIPASGRFPREGNDYPLPYPCLENPMDRGASWLQAIGLQSWTRLSDWRRRFLKSLYWICYNTASALWFGFLATRHLES